MNHIYVVFIYAFLMSSKSGTEAFLSYIEVTKRDREGEYSHKVIQPVTVA